MKYYARTVTVKDYQGHFNKAVYVNQVEFFKTNSEEKLKEFNKGKKIKFEELTETNKEYIKKLRKLEINKLYTETEQLTDSQIYWRPRISRRWH